MIGGTGPQGKGLGYRFARHGHPVVLGSRVGREGRARRRGGRRAACPGGGGVGRRQRRRGAPAPTSSCSRCRTTVTTSWSRRCRLAGKVVISCVNPLGFDKRGPYGARRAGGLGRRVRAALVPEATVVGAFHHVSAINLWGDQEHLDDEDVLVSATPPTPRRWPIELARAVTSATASTPAGCGSPASSSR